MTPERELLLAIVRQAIRDYIRLDPDSDKVSAEYHIDEGQDYKSAEDFLYNEVPLPYGNLALTLRDVCSILSIDGRRLKQRIARSIIEY